MPEVGKLTDRDRNILDSLRGDIGFGPIMEFIYTELEEFGKVWVGNPDVKDVYANTAKAIRVAYKNYASELNAMPDEPTLDYILDGDL